MVADIGRSRKKFGSTMGGVKIVLSTLTNLVEKNWEINRNYGKNRGTVVHPYDNSLTRPYFQGANSYERGPLYLEMTLTFYKIIFKVLKMYANAS